MNYYLEAVLKAHHENISKSHSDYYYAVQPLLSQLAQELEKVWDMLGVDLLSDGNTEEFTIEDGLGNYETAWEFANNYAAAHLNTGWEWLSPTVIGFPDQIPVIVLRSRKK